MSLTSWSLGAPRAHAQARYIYTVVCLCVCSQTATATQGSMKWQIRVSIASSHVLLDFKFMDLQNKASFSSYA